MNFNFEIGRFENPEHGADKLAVCGSDINISWIELKEKVDTLKNTLLQIGIKKNHAVIIYGHKEHFFVVAILACISLDIPYIPVDRIYPDERIKKIQKLSNAQILINCGDYHVNTNIPIYIDYTFKISNNFKAVFEKPLYEDDSDPLRYIIFTSGSTGEPKGVQITKSSVNSFINWVKKDYDLDENDVFMNQSPFSFDVSLYDISGALSLGGSLILTGQELAKDPTVFFGKLKELGCSVWTSTPSFAYMYIRELNFNQEYLDKLKTFIFAGEDLSPRLAQMLSEKFPDARILNAYGPTEATVTTTLIEIRREHWENKTLLPIGYKKPDSEILILNEENDRGKEGEIIIVGDHVSVGYLNNEELNKKKFRIINNKKAFYTGDLGYFAGDIIYLVGRNDDLIKLHGYRIELSEISNEIMKEKDVLMAVSIPLKRGNEIKRIVSFITTSKDTNKHDDLLKNIYSRLNKNLPSYMTPGDIKIIDEFPYNKNHKIDKSRLAGLYIELNRKDRRS